MAKITLDVILAVEEYLQSTYHFRRNILNSGKIEYTENEDSPYQTYTSQAENSVIRKTRFAFAKYASHVGSVVKEYVNSTEVPEYSPVVEFFESLPEWNGEDHVTALFSRLSGITEFQLSCMKTWFRSMVAHWIVGLDDIHSNENIPVLIGGQGCHKTTFCRMILPPQLREYFGDNLNFSNKFDADMALTNNLLVNIDELAGVSTPAQQAKLKFAISRCKVQGRPVFGRFQEDKKRYASFIATTNCEKPLHDHTGSRRYICIQLDKDKLIDTDTPINYGQLYSQVMAEIKAGVRFWFTHEEEAVLQEQNLMFQAEDEGFESIIDSFFEVPNSTVGLTAYTLEELTELIHSAYPNIEYSQGTAIRLGSAMRKLGFQQKSVNHKSLYYVNFKWKSVSNFPNQRGMVK